MKRIIEICKSEEIEDCKKKAEKYPTSDIEFVQAEKKEMKKWELI